MGNKASRDYEAGDILYRKIERSSSGIQIALFYNHYGVYIGDGMVIDLTKNDGIQRRSLSEFADDSEVHIKSYWLPQPKEKIVETAEYYLKNEEEWGEYCLFDNNCEHFATYCATGLKYSGQVLKTKAVAMAVRVAVDVASAILRNNDEDDSAGSNSSLFSNSEYNGAGPSRFDHLDTILERASHNFPVDPPIPGLNDFRLDPSSFSNSGYNGGGFSAGSLRYNPLAIIQERASYDFLIDSPTSGVNYMPFFFPPSVGKSGYGSP